jgi:hypothetical protein
LAQHSLYTAFPYPAAGAVSRVSSLPYQYLLADAAQEFDSDLDKQELDMSARRYGANARWGTYGSIQAAAQHNTLHQCTTQQSAAVHNTVQQ